MDTPVEPRPRPLTRGHQIAGTGMSGTEHETESMEKTGGHCHCEGGEPWDDADRNREQNRKQQELFLSLSVLSFGKI